MSDFGESSNIEESFEDENKVNIEVTSVNLDCVKSERKEALDFEEDSHTKPYRIALEYVNVLGESSQQTKIEEDCDNLIGFLDNGVIMETAMTKLETIKEEDHGSSNNFYCSKCKGIYNSYCLKCSTLLRILNNNSSFLSSEAESNTIPTDILEIRETSRDKGVYVLRTLPINIIFGPFEGILGIESTFGHSWKVIDNKLSNIKSGNWMKNIVCATSVSLKNLDIFQIDGNIYFQTNREITEGEELLIYYDNEELQQLHSKECLFTPQKQEKLPKIFACTMCCLGFGSNKCLMEHKSKCCRMEYSRTMKDFVLIECHYCNMWMEKWEHEEYHVDSCLQKHHRMWSGYSEAVNRSDADADVKDYCGTRQGHLNKRRGIKQYQCDICMTTFTWRNSYYRHVKNKHNNRGVKDHICLECSYQTNRKSDLQKHVNMHRGIKPFQCDICMMKFTQKSSLQTHIKNKHIDDGSVKDFKCLDCSYQTNRKADLEKHLNMHRGIQPFTCDICMMSFTWKASFDRHIKGKHTDNGSAKEYKCSECSYQTNYKSDLQRHLNNHRGIKPFQCDICMTKFTQKGHLTIHIKNKHTND